MKEIDCDDGERKPTIKERVRAAERYNNVAEVLERLKPFKLAFFTFGENMFLMELAHNKEPLAGDLRRAQNVLKRVHATCAKFRKLLKKAEPASDTFPSR